MNGTNNYQRPIEVGEMDPVLEQLMELRFRHLELSPINMARLAIACGLMSQEEADHLLSQSLVTEGVLQ